MTIENNTVAPVAITPDFFFADVQRWKEWVEKGKAYAEARLAIAATKPREAHHNPNLYQDEQGRIWDNLGDKWYILTRDSDAPYAHYVRGPDHKTRGPLRIENGSVRCIVLESGEQVRFVRRSYSEVEDWGWDIRPESIWPPGTSTYDCIMVSLNRSERGISLADALLAKKVEIEAWLGEYARDSRLHSRWDLDWSDLLLRFAPEFIKANVPDNGAVLCVLHMVLDQIQHGQQVRRYAY